MQLNDIAAIVTGGASGLGEATARRLAARGAKVTLFDLNRGLGEAVAADIQGRFAAVDIADESAVAAAVADAEAAYGVARIVVNCAGIGSPAKAFDRDGNPAPIAPFRKTIEVNLVGAYIVASRSAARMALSNPLGEERGVIINTASVAAFDGQIGQSAYSASKGGIVGMTLPLAREFARFGIRVMTIAPGLFKTPLLATLPEDAQRSLGAQVPFPSRLGAPDEYALMVESIVRNPMLNGETIRLDGAIRMSPK